MKLGMGFGEGVYQHVCEFSSKQEVSSFGDINYGGVGLSSHRDSYRNFQQLRNWRGLGWTDFDIKCRAPSVQIPQILLDTALDGSWFVG
jgi:hypothetical protein